MALFRVAGDGDGLRTAAGWGSRPGLGAMGGGEGLAVAGSFGLGARGRFLHTWVETRGMTTNKKKV